VREPKKDRQKRHTERERQPERNRWTYIQTGSQREERESHIKRNTQIERRKR